MVYVDPLMKNGTNENWRWLHSCHLFADTLEELHAFAKRLRLSPAWFQLGRRGTFPHYDLNANRRKWAVNMGAIELERREAFEKWKQLGYL